MSNKRIGDLIPIEKRGGQQAVNARYLYEWLQVKKDFSDWMKAQIIRCDLSENEDYQVFLPQKGEQKRGGSNRIDYALSLNAAKEISMMSQTQRGKEARRYFIECERIAMEKQKPMMVLPQNYEEALTKLLEQVKENKSLLIENRMQKRELARKQSGIELAYQIVKDFQKEVNESREKVKAYDKVINSSQDDGLFTTRQIAQEIGLTDHKLYAILMQIGVLYKQSDTYMMHADYVGWQLHRMVSHVVNEKTGRVRTYLKWSNRGRVYIHALHDCGWDKRKAYNKLREIKGSKNVKEA